LSGGLLVFDDQCPSRSEKDAEPGHVTVSHAFTGAEVSSERTIGQLSAALPRSDRLAFATRGGRLRVMSLASRGDGAIVRRLAFSPPGRACYWTRGTDRRVPVFFPDGTGRWIAGVREYEFGNRVGGLPYEHRISIHDALSALAAPGGAWLADFTEGAVTFRGPDVEAPAGLTLDGTSRPTASDGHVSDGAGLLPALGGEGGDVRLIDPARPVGVAGRGGAHGPAMKCAVDPRGTRVAVRCDGSRRRQCHRPRPAHSQDPDVRAALRLGDRRAIRSDGLVATAGRRGRVSTWNPATGMLYRSRLTCGAQGSSCRFSPDGTTGVPPHAASHDHARTARDRGIDE
jgi:hypothetical protein